ncbi:MAG: hypothetical protein DWQ36_22445 [Acidobacteria bacterium]|nr:MAG: hypothetical protein DWQ30_13825 [Acidobacteriota bacterium]REK00525.1 MAG: hypothetical protein DWQ36_22445 [Acidobacteriota bacterium]
MSAATATTTADPTRRAPRRRAVVLGAALLVVPTATPLLGWTKASQELLAEATLQVTPRDFARQLEKHEARFLDGVRAPFRDVDPSAHERNQDGSGQLHRAIVLEIERTIAAIRSHRPFAEIAYQAGVLVHYVNDASYPLGCSTLDRWEDQYAADFPRYLESAAPRLEFLFYGLSPELERGDVEGFVERLLERCRSTYPLVGQEYRRIGKLPGSRYFDDRSSAFGVAGIAHSRAITAAALALRYVWVQAGGADWRSPPPEGEGRLFLLRRERPETASRR